MNENASTMEQRIEQTTATNKIKPRNAFVAFIFSLILPGLGQVYNGQLIKGIIFFCLPLLVPFILGLTRMSTYFYGLISLLVIEILVRVYIIIDGVIYARRKKDYIPKPYNRWYYHLLIAGGMFAILMVYDNSKVLGLETFKIPTTSNNPTFQVDDLLAADMRAYHDQEPEYGDLVVFSRPDGYNYIFRVVGRPGDKIEIIDNILSINGVPAKATFIKETTNENRPVLLFEEELPNGHKHSIYKFTQPLDSTKSNIKNIVVPANNYFLMGDNRDNAADSRYEGFISKDRIKGRIVFSYWGETGTKRMNIDFRDK